MNQYILDCAEAVETEGSRCPGCGAPLDEKGNCWECGYQERDSWERIEETGLVEQFNRWVGR